MLDRFDTRPSSDSPILKRPTDADVHSARRVIRLKLSRLASGQGMFVDDLVKELEGMRFEEPAVRWAIHEGRASGLWLITNLMHQGAAENGPVQCREGQYIQPVSYIPPCSVDLRGEKPLVFGKEKHLPSSKERLAVELLTNAYPDGLTTAELREKFGDGDPVATLRDLGKKDEDWKRAIIMAGVAKQGQKYRLAPDQQSP